MAVESRDITQASEILQDTMPATSTLNSGGENLTYANSPFSLAKIYRWLVAISKAIIGEKTRRNGARRIQGLEQTNTGTITSSGTSVTGSGTLFLSELFAGAFIAGTTNEYREVLTIASDTALTLSAAFSVDIGAGQSYTRLQSLSERVDGIEEYVNNCINGEFSEWAASSFASPASNTETADNYFVNYDGTIGTFAISRESFTVGQTDSPGEPQYYFRWNHTAAGSGQTVKRIRYKLSSVRTLAGQTVQVTFYAKFASSATITVGATQYFGTGGAPSSDVVVTAKTRTLTTTFSRYTVTLIIPSISGKTIGTNSDDALYFNINLPLNATHDFSLSNMTIYKGTAELPFRLSSISNAMKSAIQRYSVQRYAKLTDTKGSNVPGGTFTAGAWVTRTLNTEDSNAAGIVSLASNQMTLGTGIYIIRASVPAYSIDRHQSQLYNVTDAVTTITGTSEYAQASSGGDTRSLITGRFSIVGTKVFEIRHRCQTTLVTYGLGLESNFGLSEIYTQVELWKIG